MNRPLDDFAADERMTMNVFGLMQTFPWPGKLGFSERQAQHVAEAERLVAEDTELGLLAGVRSYYYRLAYIDRALLVMEETRQLLRDFRQVSSTLYSVGSGLQQDLLQAEVSVARMTADIVVMRQERLATAARLNALLGREASTPVAATELPEIGAEPAGVDSLIEVAVARRPALLAAQERIRAAEAGYRAARRELYPDINISLSYNQRPEFVDMASLMIGVDVPLWAGSSRLPKRREAEALQAEAEAEALELYNETYARLAELRAQAERAGSLSRLYATAILPQARAAVESALSAYRVGRVDYMTLLENQMTVNRYEIETIRLRAEFHRAVAEIEALVGRAPGGAE
jgi:outer membrane protein TolC